VLAQTGAALSIVVTDFISAPTQLLVVYSFTLFNDPETGNSVHMNKSVSYI
jgi:hypothetical protein